MQSSDTGLSLKSNMIWNSIGSLTYFGCQWLITILVVRVSNSFEAAGTLSLAMSIANIFTPFALFRMRAYQVSDLSGEVTTAEYMGFRLFTSSLALVVCMAYSILTCAPAAIPCIFIYLLFKTVEQVIDVLAGLEQQKSRLDLAGKSLIIRGALTLFSFSAALWLSSSIELAVASMLLSSILVLLGYDLRNASQFDSLFPHWNGAKFSRLFIQCLPVVIASIAAGAVMTFPKQHLEALYGTEILGIYSSIAAPVALVQLGASYIYSPLLGSFATSFSYGDIRSFFKTLGLTIIGITAIGILAEGAALAFGADAIDLLFGPTAAFHAYLLVPMIACSLFTGFYLFLSDLLLSIREFKGNCLSGVLSLAVALPLTFILVGSYGMNGVSFTGIAAYAAASVIALLFLGIKMRENTVSQKETPNV